MHLTAKDSIDGRRAASSIAVTIVLLGFQLQPWQTGIAVAAEPDGRARAIELVAKLGHEKFAIREQAAAGLIGLELDAVAALRVGAESHDREIRYRSAKLLALILEIDLQNRFEKFKKATDPKLDYGLPGWDAYREVVGDSPIARSIFVSMHEEESRLLREVDSQSKRVRVALADRCEQIRGQAVFGRIQVRLGTTATLLFVATRDDVEVSPLVQSVIYMACGDSSFEAALENARSREVLAALTERWIARQPLQGITYALHLGLSNGLSGCLPRAREVFKSPVASASDRIYACLCVAKFGDATDIARLEAHLEDVNICTQAQVDGQVVVTEMRDLALATMLHLAGQKPKDFGFDRIVTDRRLVFSLQSLGFRDEQSRVQAIAAWRDFRRANPDPDAAP